MPFFSIIIPTYKNPDILKTVMDSVLSQTFQDFEMIITDDSPDDQVKDFIEAQYKDDRIIYFQNRVALGTPENWNSGIKKASGEWIKLLHDDDWFAADNALERFAEAINKNPDAKVFHCDYENVFLDGGYYAKPRAGQYLKKQFKENKFTLVSRNFIGPPSVVLTHSSLEFNYDGALKWMVDIDYYMRIALKTEFVYIPRVLVKVGVSKKQVTAYTHNVPEIEIPEALHVFEKWKHKKPWQNIVYFDAWWRLIRNLGIRNVDELKRLAVDREIPGFVVCILQVQRRIPHWLLKFGPFSKMAMGCSFLNCSKKN